MTLGSFPRVFFRTETARQIPYGNFLALGNWTRIAADALADDLALPSLDNGYLLRLCFVGFAEQAQIGEHSDGEAQKAR